MTPKRLIIRASNIGAGGKQASEDERKGVLPGLNQWPPKGITELSQPKPEDDPANFDAQGYATVHPLSTAMFSFCLPIDRLCCLRVISS